MRQASIRNLCHMGFSPSRSHQNHHQLPWSGEPRPQILDPEFSDTALLLSLLLLFCSSNNFRSRKDHECYGVRVRMILALLTSTIAGDLSSMCNLLAANTIRNKDRTLQAKAFVPSCHLAIIGTQFTDYFHQASQVRHIGRTSWWYRIKVGFRNRYRAETPWVWIEVTGEIQQLSFHTYFVSLMAILWLTRDKRETYLLGLNDWTENERLWEGHVFKSKNRPTTGPKPRIQTANRLLARD